MSRAVVVAEVSAVTGIAVLLAGLAAQLRGTDVSQWLGLVSLVVSTGVTIYVTRAGRQWKREDSQHEGHARVRVREIDAIESHVERLTAEIQRLQDRIMELERENEEQERVIIEVRAQMLAHLKAHPQIEAMYAVLVEHERRIRKPA